ncbi:unnamed protein product [Allacma fusca]|uniref:Fatty acid synthase n=1 Tax=Allacma fusca TaxID=39272 RepID=A0A8J2KKT2_9HEXA|nr:unnamed protein product [Allacma fusca]
MQKNLDLESEIVISGLSGRFPQSDNLDEFWENLVEGRDMVSESHTRFNDLGLKMPSRMGILKSLEKFDAEYFSVHGKQANVLDPRLRKLLEVTYEAIVDAGVNPSTLQGTNTGVFVAASDSEASAIWKRSGEKSNIYGVLGSAVSMLANRLSFAFGFHGPSYVVDTACSSASVATQQALMSIQAGLCDAAIIAGGHIHHDPVSSHMFHHLEMTSADGRCKVFDDSADGYCRAEAVVATYICKKQVAKRAYATLVHAGINNDGYKEQGITFPSEVLQERVMRRVYDDIGLNPLEVDYIEAHGTGTRVGDPEEIMGISKVFCEGRTGPLLVGSVKSNMGHPEPAAGLCSISKVILSNIAGIVPGNLHYKTPNKDIPALHDGRVQVVAKNQPFRAKYVGLNAMGFGGTNVHILLKLESKELPPAWTPPIPLLILSSGRTEEAVNHFLEKSLNHKENHHFVKLLHELSKDKVSKHPYRGFLISNSGKQDVVVDEVDVKESVWFVFTGMGSQWAGMSKDLIKFDAFKNSVSRSAEYLQKVNFNLMALLASGKTELFEEFSNAMVSINVVQVALVDLLKSIGIVPDGVIVRIGSFHTTWTKPGCKKEQNLQ